VFNVVRFKAVIKESGARLIILNNPVNPTGAVWSKTDLLALGEIAINQDCLVICDEVYDRFVYGGAKFYSLANLFPDQNFRFIRVNSFSKTYAMMGYRIGYVLAQKEIINKISSLQSQVSSAANTFGQKLAVKILENCQIEVGAMVEEFSRNRTIALSFFSKNKIEVVSFEGAFYCFFHPPKIFTEKKELFCEAALEAGVGLVDGEESGAGGWARICYAQPRDVLEKGLNRLGQLFSGS
jgi:aspartate aminotransferase